VLSRPEDAPAVEVDDARRDGGGNQGLGIAPRRREHLLGEALRRRQIGAGDREPAEGEAGHRGFWRVRDLGGQGLEPAERQLELMGSVAAIRDQRRAQGELETELGPRAISPGGLRFEHGQREAQVRDGLRVGRAPDRETAGAVPVRDRRRPGAGLGQVMREDLGVTVGDLRLLLLDRRGRGGVQLAPPLGGEAPVGRLLGQDVGEPARLPGRPRGLPQEAGLAQAREGERESRLGQARHLAQQRQGHVAPEHRGGVQQVPIARSQAIDARRDRLVHRVGNPRDPGRRVGHDDPGQLLEEERDAFRLAHQGVGDAGRHLPAGEQGVDDREALGGTETVQDHLRRGGAAERGRRMSLPARPQDQDARGGDARRDPELRRCGGRRTLAWEEVLTRFETRRAGKGRPGA
jgi:hypothetical protein